jgi:uncharacterized membrane protein
MGAKEDMFRAMVTVIGTPILAISMLFLLFLIVDEIKQNRLDKKLKAKKKPEYFPASKRDDLN